LIPLILQGSALETATALISVTVGLVVIAVAVEGYFRRPIADMARFVLGASGLLFVVPELLTSAAAVVFLAVREFCSASLRQNRVSRRSMSMRADRGAGVPSSAPGAL